MSYDGPCRFCLWSKSPHKEYLWHIMIPFYWCSWAWGCYSWDLILVFGSLFFSPKDPRQAMFWPQSISLKSNLFSASYNYHTICSNPLFFAIQYFSLYKLKVFSNRLPLVCLTFLGNVNHFEWLTLQFFTLLMSSFLLLLSRLFQLTLFNEVRKFLNTKASVFYQ